MIDQFVLRWLTNAADRWLETKHARQTICQEIISVRGIQVIARLELAENALRGADLSTFENHAGDKFETAQTKQGVIELSDALNTPDYGTGGEK